MLNTRHNNKMDFWLRWLYLQIDIFKLIRMLYAIKFKTKHLEEVGALS